jgi:hypothetical protein
MGNDCSAWPRATYSSNETNGCTRPRRPRSLVDRRPLSYFPLDIADKHLKHWGTINNWCSRYSEIGGRFVGNSWEDSESFFFHAGANRYLSLFSASSSLLSRDMKPGRNFTWFRFYLKVIRISADIHLLWFIARYRFNACIGMS